MEGESPITLKEKILPNKMTHSKQPLAEANSRYLDSGGSFEKLKVNLYTFLNPSSVYNSCLNFGILDFNWAIELTPSFCIPPQNSSFEYSPYQ